jgi:hypothetical protein
MDGPSGRWRHLARARGFQRLDTRRARVDARSGKARARQLPRHDRGRTVGSEHGRRARAGRAAHRRGGTAATAATAAATAAATTTAATAAATTAAATAAAAATTKSAAGRELHIEL